MSTSHSFCIYPSLKAMNAPTRLEQNMNHHLSCCIIAILKLSLSPYLYAKKEGLSIRQPSLLLRVVRVIQIPLTSFRSNQQAISLRPQTSPRAPDFVYQVQASIGRLTRVASKLT